MSAQRSWHDYCMFEIIKTMKEAQCSKAEFEEGIVLNGGRSSVFQSGV